MLSILTVNIGSAALARAERILRWLQNRPEDVFVLTETSSGAGTKLILDAFRKKGCVIASNDFVSKERGVAIVSKITTSNDFSKAFTLATIPERVAALHVDKDGFQFDIIGLYVPSRNQQHDKIIKKQRFIESFVRDIENIPREVLKRTIICGDYNVVSRGHFPRYGKFMAFEYDFLETLHNLSLIDAFTLRNPSAQEYSWVGRTGDGYCYDYFNVGEAIRAKVKACTFHHDTRDVQGLTDHSALGLYLS